MNNTKSNLKFFLDIRSITMLFYGFSAGMPILLIFSSLSLWLREAGVERSAVTYFSWAALGYSFKFIWAPLIDKFEFPYLTRLMGRRRSWIIFSQFMIILSILFIAFIDPASSKDSLFYMGIAAVMLGFSSATQDIVIDAYRIESAPIELQAILSASYIGGYRVGMIASGAGALFIASYLGSTKTNYNYEAWKITYICMALFMLIGVLTTILRPEPKHSKILDKDKNIKNNLNFFFLFLVIVACFISSFVYLKDFSDIIRESLISFLYNESLAGFISNTTRLVISLLTCSLSILLINKTKLVDTQSVRQSYLKPIQCFFNENGKKLSILLLLLIGSYRVSDIVLGVISNVFYQDMGYTKDQIATVVKTFGLVMTILGGFIGGFFTVRFGIIKMLLWGAILSAGTNLLFLLLAKVGNSLPMLYLVISADNLSAGLASAAFVAFLSSLTNVEFTAVQYAIFTSLMTLLPKILGGYSGSMVDSFGYTSFFTFTTILGLPVLYLIFLIRPYIKNNKL